MFLYGHSMGGMIAVTTVTRNSAFFRGLVLGVPRQVHVVVSLEGDVWRGDLDPLPALGLLLRGGLLTWNLFLIYYFINFSESSIATLNCSQIINY